VTERLTEFEHLLLGLICAEPSSGYDLKRAFSTTPIGVYQPSSGALYPALRRLQTKGFVQSQPRSTAGVSPGRRRSVYQATPAGWAAHESWVRTPVETASVARDLGLHLMRFVMMEPLLTRDEVLDFLCGLRDALAALVAQLERYTGAATFEGLHPGLALDHGIQIYRASLDWAEHAIASLTT
jgi:PadR family transcriptional regulator, regulatory protein AphA